MWICRVVKSINIFIFRYIVIPANRCKEDKYRELAFKGAGGTSKYRLITLVQNHPDHLDFFPTVVNIEQLPLTWSFALADLL